MKLSARELLPGLSYSQTGSVDVSPEMHAELIALADCLELEADLPIDTEHVAAAVVAAVLHGELPRMQPVNWACEQLKSRLMRHIRRFYEELDGRLDRDDPFGPDWHLSPQVA